MYRTALHSPVGRLYLTSNGVSLTGLWMEGQKYFPDKMWSAAKEASDLAVFQQTEVWLNAYFSRKDLPVRPPLEPKGSLFQQAVWALLLDIPWGETVTYGMLTQILRAKGIPASPQAVGGAVGHNPVSILIPCHRVLGADGSLTGYACGLERKRFLLELEGTLFPRQDDTDAR